MSGVEKPMPPRSAPEAAPPNEEREFFERCGEHPFRCTPGEFEMVNAWWLAEASLLAYSDPEFVGERFQEAGLREVRHFAGGSTQCYAAHDDEKVFVAFSGTDVREREGNSTVDALTDWLVNLTFDTTDSGHGGRVHRGFKEALDEVWDPQDKGEEDRLKPHLDRVCEGGRRQVWFTGHSLGGALATLAAGRYDHAPELYTFGSPRAGDRAYVEGLDVHSHRFVNGEDIVPKLPLRGPYRHLGPAKRIGGDGLIQDVQEARQGRWAALRESIARAFGALVYSRSGSLRELPKDALLDHAPVFYVVHIWNNYVRDEVWRADLTQ